MKKVVSCIIIIVLLLLCGCSCGEKDSVQYENEETCKTLVTQIMSFAYNERGNYSHLPQTFKKNISKENFNLLNYREDKKYMMRYMTRMM